MNIETTQVQAFCRSVKKTYEKMPYSEYNDGVRSGMEEVLLFIKAYEEAEGRRIARASGQEV